MCRITRSRPFMDTHVFLPTICLSALHSFVSVLHAYLQIFRIRWKSKKIQTQHRLVLTPPRSICCFWSRLYWTSSVYLAHTLLFLFNNNTAVPGSSCSQRSGAASVKKNEHGLRLVSRATMWCSFFLLRLFGEGRMPHPPRAHLSTSLSSPRARRHDEMFWRRLFITSPSRTCHSRPATTSLWAGRSKNSWFLIIFLLLSYLIYFHHRLLAFHHPCGSDTHSKNNTYQTTLCNRGLQDRSEA